MKRCPLALISLSVALAMAFALSLPTPVLAAKPDGLEIERPKPEQDSGFRKAGKAILDVQKALSDMGYYLGSINGHLNSDTRAAIRVYQQGAGLAVDGKVSRHLWDLLTNAVEIHNLLKRLDNVRTSGKTEARKALLAHPATRDLITDRSDEKADPKRDASACFAAPTVRCLIDAALANVKAVFKPELRDWALSEILVAQSRAGLNQAAMETAARMTDPRLIIVALRDIAEGQATAGNGDAARDAVGIIPDVKKRADALVSIAEIQTQRGVFTEARKSIAQLNTLLDKVGSGAKRISLETRIAVMLAKAGDHADAADLLARAETWARTKVAGTERGVALRHVAAALAETERPDQALGVLNDINASSERTSVLISTATAQAQAGDAAAALAIADSIDAVRYRAVLLGKIALSQAISGHFENAETTLQTAIAAIDKIGLPYARAFALSRIALTMSKVGALLPSQAEETSANQTPTGWSRFTKAAELAGGIEDNRLKAHALWSISADQRRSGDLEGGKTTERLADAASAKIKSRLTRVWMFAELATDQARSGDMEMSWRTLRRGLDNSEAIDNSWGQARALAKLAQTMVEMVALDTPQQ